MILVPRNDLLHESDALSARITVLRHSLDSLSSSDESDHTSVVLLPHQHGLGYTLNGCEWM